MVIECAEYDEDLGAYVIDLRATHQEPALEVTLSEVVTRLSEFEIEKLFDRLREDVWGHINMYTLHTHKGVFIELTTKEETDVR